MLGTEQRVDGLRIQGTSGALEFGILNQTLLKRGLLLCSDGGGARNKCSVDMLPHHGH